ncbi:MAG: acylneuraminate cytidylyltransferase family protein [Deltaproteobacteria bacterium]|jgi:CMP-N-acetylneuraminic acid synthetase|nr:acylneuraminate cytidylyltransferase family protein [Deltaproteobacteria bacterium]
MIGQTLGIIPARGGSKGIKRKNIKPIAGHPLLAWTIKAALESKLLDHFVVSTEDDEIALVAGLYGAKVAVRPPELAKDDSTTKEVLAQVVKELGDSNSLVVLLQATSPIRSADLIDRTISAFKAGDYDSMSTGGLQLQYPPHGVEHRRQDVKSLFINDGSVIVLKAANLEKGSLFGQKAGTLITSREENVDIDEEFDFFVAEKILEKYLAEGRIKAPVLAIST